MRIGSDWVPFQGLQTASTPFGDGLLCIGGQAYRLSAAQSDARGIAELPVDYGLPPSPAAAILPGSTWNFQIIYRDPAGPGGTGFNLTDGLTIDFVN